MADVCPDRLAELDLYLDDELAEEDRRDLERHLDACTGCRDGLIRREETKHALRRVGEGATCSPAFLASLHSAIDGDASRALEPERGSGWRGIAAAALTLTVGSAIFAFGQLAPGGGSTAAEASGAYDSAAGPAPVVVDESLRWHARSVPVEVTGPDHAVVQDWFADKVPFPVLPPEFASRAHLIGGRLSNVESSEAAFLVYDVDGTKLSVMVFDPRETPMPRAPELRDGGVYLRNANGLSVAVHERGGVGYTYTSELPDRSLTELVNTAFSY